MNIYAYGNPLLQVKAREVCVSSKPDYHASHQQLLELLNPLHGAGSTVRCWDVRDSGCAGMLTSTVLLCCAVLECAGAAPAGSCC
jgi:hypothetical protein